jgi:hypothetical protein
VIAAGETWEKAKWPFLSEVLGIRGGQGLAQRFLAGTVKTSDGAQFNVGKGGAVETQFSIVNPEGATTVFTTTLAAAKPGGPGTPVATVHPYGRGRIAYVGFTFENLAPAELAPAFSVLLTATGLSTKPGPIAGPTRPTQRTGAAPDAIRVYVKGTPTTAEVSWVTQTATVQTLAVPGTATPARRAASAQAPSSGPSVTVERLVPNAAPVSLSNVSVAEMKAVDPGPLTPGQALTYRVTLTEPNAAPVSKEATFTPPLPQDPDSLTAALQADNSVILTWPEVPGVTSYQIINTHIRPEVGPVIVRRATEWRSPKLKSWISEWAVASFYEPGGTLTSSYTWPRAVAQGPSNAGLPTPTKPFLTVPNGAGGHAEAQAHFRTRCADALLPGSLCKAAGFLGDATNWEAAWHAAGASQTWPAATFNNHLDLGTGRRVNCTPRKNGATVCWATSHGTVSIPTRPKSLTVIIMADDKAFFGNWEHEAYELPKDQDFFSQGGWTDNWLDFEHAFAKHADLTSGAAFDSQGRKGVPHACLSCHGGRYDPLSKQVIGASLLPVVPGRVKFGGNSRGAEEESIRRINQIILQSNPAPGIVDQINTMYNGSPNTPGATANDAAVPSGWSQQVGLYRQVVGPYCASCHFAQRGPFNFRSWGNMLQNKNAVQRTVCQEFTMPHSEILFRKFWTEGNPGSLPGLLSTSLGFATCRQ